MSEPWLFDSTLALVEELIEAGDPDVVIDDSVLKLAAGVTEVRGRARQRVRARSQPFRAAHSRARRTWSSRA